MRMRREGEVETLLLDGGLPVAHGNARTGEVTFESQPVHGAAQLSELLGRLRLWMAYRSFRVAPERARRVGSFHHVKH